MGRAARGRCRRESAAASGKKKHMSDVPFLSALQNLKNEVASRSCGWGRWLIKGMYAVLDQGLISGSNFLLGILLARWTGAEQYGAYALAFAIFILVSIVYQALVLEPMTVFGPSVYHTAPKQYLGILVQLQMVLGAAMFGVGALGGGYFHARVSAELGPALMGATIAAPCVLLFWFARRACYVELSPSRALAGAVFLWVPWNICYPLVTKFWGLAETGTLRALLNLALPITQAHSALTLLFLPYTARLGQQEGWRAMKWQAMRIGGVYAAGAGVYWLFVCMFGGPLVHFLYAGRYTEIIPLLPWVAVSSIIGGALLGPTIVIRAMQSPASVCWIYLCSSAVAAGVGAPAIWAWGMRGAVVALVLSSLAALVSGYVILRTRVGTVQSRATFEEPVVAVLPH